VIKNRRFTLFLAQSVNTIIQNLQRVPLQNVFTRLSTGIFKTTYMNNKKTEEREALRKQGLNEKTAASVLLKLFISGNERCHTTDAP